MRRTLLFIPFGLIAGAIVGLLAGGIVLNLTLGSDPNDSRTFVLLSSFPGFAAALAPPRRLPWQIAGAASLLFGFVAALFSFSQQLAEYGQAHFQARVEMKINGILQPLGADLIFGKLSPHVKSGA